MVELSTGSAGGLFLILLFAVAMFGSLARVIKVPYPILLVVSGIGLSLLPHMPHFALPPDLVFLVFLPPLLYSAAWTLSWREFQRNFKSIAMLAFGLVLATVLLLTFLSGHFLPGFDWKSGLLLGAVVAATDAIAATAIASRMGLPHSVVSLLEAESLVNDATGLLALQFGVTILLTGRTPGIVDGVGRFVFLTAGGVLIGLLVGFVVAWIEEFIDDGPIEIVLSVLVPYAAYELGDRAHVSGAMAVIACGMYMSRQSVNFMSAQVRLQSTAVWDALTFVLNGIVFLLLGLQLPYVLSQIHGIPLHKLALYGVGFSLAIIALRVLWICLDAVITGVLNHSRKAGQQMVQDKRHLAVIGWGGMRGVLSLAAAVSLPLTTATGPFPQRSLIIFLAFCLIVSTLVLQGLSLPLLIRRLGLAGQSSLQVEEQEARRTMLRDALRYLDRRRRRSTKAQENDVLDELHRVYRGRLDALPTSRQAPYAGLVSRKQRRQTILDVLEVERAALLKLRDEQKIDDEVLRSLQRELDLSESRVHTSTA